ncbi:HEAT repeat domain-containing protein [Psychrobacter alimentarius]|uniref:HEAT repeat domain-containing protein n=1 Tax=Psychrobacter alimentarius TaxID=261164 RepID=UPI00191B434D|nr:HEAT repeat domain-containing protein [Psychrobacter alimentarius]
MKTIALPYWGQIIGLVSRQPNIKHTPQKITKSTALPVTQGRSLFITRQPLGAESSHADLYRLDNVGEQISLSTTALPCAMDVITTINDDTIILLGCDGHLYQTDWQGETIHEISQESLFASMIEAQNSTENTETNTDTEFVTKSLSTNSSPKAIAMTTLHQAVVVLYPNDIVVCPFASNNSLTPSVQTIANQVVVQPYAASKSQKATSLAASSDGKWLVIGDNLGNVSSYQWLSNDNAGTQLIQSSHSALHQGRVNALCFEPIGHYFFSAGTDKQLYRTHVQGELQAIDRAKSSQHSQMITALCVSDTRLFTIADDNSIKSWAFDKGQPNTCKEDLSKTQRLVYSSYAEKPALLAVGSDQSLRFLPIDETQNSKLLTVATVIEDGYHRVQQLLTDHSNNSEVAFLEGLALLESQADKQTIKLVGRLLADRSNSLSASRALQLVQWLAGTTLETRLAILEEQLNSPRSSGVRLAAFEGLAIAATHTASPHVLPAYLEYALGCANEDVISAALQSYLKIAVQDADKQPRVLPILQQALSHSMLPIRRQALASLEHLLPDISPKADFMALDSRYPDIIQAGLIRLYQRGLLDNPEVSRQLMLLQSHHQADVRQTAFYAALLAQPELITALKQQAHALDDAQLLRTLTDFDDFRLLRGTVFDNVKADKHTSDHDELVTIKIGKRFDQQNKNATGRTNQGTEEDSAAINLALSTQDFATSAAQTSMPKRAIDKSPILNNSNLEPLLQNLSNRYEDIGFRAAYALACLQDERAFGTLIRFMHHKNDTFIRAGVAAALGYLQLADGKAILPTLLDDSDAGVRQVAMSALGKLVSDDLSWVAFGFASKHQDIHERALAILLTQVLNDKKVSADSSSMSTILAQALNNPFTSIRLEVVKVLLNRALERASKSAIINMIEQLQHSLFEDVHQVALEEWQRLLLQSVSKSATTQDSTTDTYQAVLTLLFADNFANIRKQAFDTALNNSKRLGFTELMLTALASPYLDIKRLALSHLQTKASTQHLRALMPALIALLADDSMDLRQQALEVALAATDMGISFSPNHNSSRKNDNDTSPIDHEALFSAGLSSPYPDIQLTVAKLLARQSRDYPEPLKVQYEANAYAVFEQYLNKEIPVVVIDKKNNEDYKQWHHHVTEALTGLATLSDPQKYHALDWYARYLHHPDADFKALAPKLMYVAPAQNAEVADVLATWQKDERPIIRQSASLALAVWGDSRGQHFFSNTSSNSARTNDNNQGSLRHLVEPIGPIQWLQARAGLGITQAQQLRELFDTQSYAPAARLLLIFNALASPLALPLMRPERLIEALSFADNETAVVYAHVLARFDSPLISNWQYLSKYLSQKIDSILSAHPKTLTLLPETSGTNALSTTDTRANILSTVDVAGLQQFAHLTQHEHPLIRAQAVAVLGHLSHLLTQQPYDDEAQVVTAVQSWRRSIEALLQRHHSAPIITDDANQQGLRRIDTDHSYQTLAFGAWLGVIRESDNDNSSSEQAIRGLMWLTKASADSNQSKAIDWADSVSRALLPLLHRPHIETRELAWDCLTQLPVPASKLAEYAMSTPYRDMVKRGLQCLIDSKDDALVDKQLRSLLLTNHQLLAEETYQLLKARVGHLPASIMALHTESLPLLRQLVSEWRQITTRTSNSTITTATTLDTSDQVLSEQALRQDKLTFLLQARHCHDWQARYQTFMQLIEFDEVLFTDTAFNNTKLNNTSLIDELFTFLLDSTNKYEQGQILSLITQVLQSCQRVQAAVHNNNINKELDKKSVEEVAQTAYNKLLDLLDNSTLKLSNADLYRAIGTLRDRHMAAPLRHRLQKLFEHPASHSHQERQQLFDTLVMISGYDQPIHDYLDEDKDLRWLQRQHQRDPAGLLSLFVLLLRYADYAHAAQLLKSLAWINPVYEQDTTIGNNIIDKNHNTDKEDIATRIDMALALSYEQLPAKYTQNLIEAIAYRAKKRKNHADVLKNILKKALSNKDAHVPFLAAEGLALCGNNEGLSTLMASIDYHTDGDVRRRSVLAIGEMMQVEPQPADKSAQSSAVQTTDMTNALYKAYDKLIKLAEDDEHYLQDVASEALGHIAQGGHFEYSAQIFDLLTSQLSDAELQPYNPAITHWLNGLRWLNTNAAWAQIRSHIQRQLHQQLLFAPQQHAISLLSHHDSEANKTLLLDILKQYGEQTAILETAYTAAQNLWGSHADHIYTYDWAAIQNPNEDFAMLATLSLKRIVTYSSIDTLAHFITEHIHQLPAQTYTVLQNALLAKPDMSHPQLRSLMDSPDAQIQHIGLRYITQHPNQYLDTQMQIDCKQHLVSAQQQWQYLLDTVTARPAMQQDDSWLTEVRQVATTITHLLWITCRYTTPDKAVFTWLAAQLASPMISSVTALGTAVSHYWQQALLGLLARQASDDHLLTELIPTLTKLANEQITPLVADDKALLLTLLERLSVQDNQVNKANEAGALSRLVGLFSQRSDDTEEPNVTPQTDLNEQLLAAIKAKDAAALYHCAQNHHAETAIRIRAIEALGQLHDPNIDTWLDALIQAPAEANSDVQKLAYKVLRRWQRNMTRVQQKRPQAPNLQVMKATHLKAVDTQQNQREGQHHDQ